MTVELVNYGFSYGFIEMRTEEYWDIDGYTLWLCQITIENGHL